MSTMKVKIIKVGFIGFCLAWMAAKVPVGELLTAIRETSMKFIAAAFLFHGMTLVLDTVRHQILLKSDIRLSDALRAKFWGTFSGNLVPTSIGSDATRGWWLIQHHSRISKSKVLASLMLSRVQGLLIVPSMIATGVLLDPESSALHWKWALPFGLGGSLATLGILRLVALSKPDKPIAPHQRRKEAPTTPKNRAVRLAYKMRETLEDCRPDSLTWAKGLGISAALLTSNSLLLWCLCRGAKVDGSFFKLMWVGPSVGLATLLPIGFNSFGTQDISWIHLMARTQRELPSYLGISMIWHTIRITWSLPGLFFFPRGNSVRSPSIPATHTLTESTFR